MVDDESIVDDFTDADLALASIHSSSSSESEDDVLEGFIGELQQQWSDKQ